MLQFRTVESNHLANTIREFYLKDPVFLNEYHSERHNGHEACIQSCVDGFKDYDAKDAAMYKVLSDNEDVGFFSLIADKFLNAMNLYQFYILPQHRSKDTRSQMIEAAKQKSGDFELVAAVYDQNLPVMRFYSKVSQKVLFKTSVKSLNVTVFQIKEGKKLWQ